MRKQWTVFAAVMMIVFLSVFGAAAAQGPGPQGVGSEKAAQSSNGPRSYNPIKWIKKDPKTKPEKPKKEKDKKPSEKSSTPDAPMSPQKA